MTPDDQGDNGLFPVRFRPHPEHLPPKAGNLSHFGTAIKVVSLGSEHSHISAQADKELSTDARKNTSKMAIRAHQIPSIRPIIDSSTLKSFSQQRDGKITVSADDPETRKSPLNHSASALVTARMIDDIHDISYPDGIWGPKTELNLNPMKRKFRYCVYNFQRK